MEGPKNRDGPIKSTLANRTTRDPIPRETSIQSKSTLASGQNQPVLGSIQCVQGLKLTPDGWDIHTFLAAGGGSPDQCKAERTKTIRFQSRFRTLSTIATAFA